MDDTLTRKEFFKKGLLSIFKPVKEAVEERIESLKTGLLRPPGAVDELSFIAGCTKCDLCMEACPHGAIKVAGANYGIAAGTPYIDPLDTPCMLCDEMPCIDVCEPGVLKPVKREDVRMGLAELDPSRCLAWKGVICTACFESCPLSGSAITMDGLSRPSIERDRCTGCGVCENVCISKPRAIRTVPHGR